LSSHSGCMAKAGDFVLPDIDLVFAHDANRPHPVDVLEEELGFVDVFDRERVLLLLDHYVSPTESIANLHRRLRTFAAEKHVRLFEVGRGISHQVLPEEGFVAPGMLIVGADSHTCTFGALNAMGFGAGSLDVAAAMGTGKMWLRVPTSIRVLVRGEWPAGVFSKDLVLFLIGQFGAGGATYRSVEVEGPAIRELSVDARMTIANMGIEMGAKAWLMPADAVVLNYLAGRARYPVRPIEPDHDAEYESVHEVGIDGLVPQVSLPHAVDNVLPVTEVVGRPIQQVVIGTCTNARSEDLKIAARILAGRHVHPDVRLFVVPASQRVLESALRTGVVEALAKAGAILGTPGCNGCVGGTHYAVPSDGVHMVTTANRNFKGRTGNPNAFIYLASPATAAASAIEGKLADPRPYFQ